MMIVASKATNKAPDSCIRSGQGLSEVSSKALCENKTNIH